MKITHQIIAPINNRTLIIRDVPMGYNRKIRKICNELVAKHKFETGNPYLAQLELNKALDELGFTYEMDHESRTCRVINLRKVEGRRPVYINYITFNHEIIRKEFKSQYEAQAWVAWKRAKGWNQPITIRTLDGNKLWEIA